MNFERKNKIRIVLLKDMGRINITYTIWASYPPGTYVARPNILNSSSSGNVAINDGRVGMPLIYVCDATIFPDIICAFS